MLSSYVDSIDLFLDSHWETDPEGSKLDQTLASLRFAHRRNNLLPPHISFGYRQHASVVFFDQDRRQQNLFFRVETPIDPGYYREKHVSYQSNLKSTALKKKQRRLESDYRIMHMLLKILLLRRKISNLEMQRKHSKHLLTAARKRKSLGLTVSAGVVDTRIHFDKLTEETRLRKNTMKMHRKCIEQIGMDREILTGFISHITLDSSYTGFLDPPETGKALELIKQNDAAYQSILASMRMHEVKSKRFPLKSELVLEIGMNKNNSFPFYPYFSAGLQLVPWKEEETTRVDFTVGTSPPFGRYRTLQTQTEINKILSEIGGSGKGLQAVLLQERDQRSRDLFQKYENLLIDIDSKRNRSRILQHQLKAASERAIRFRTMFSKGRVSSFDYQKAQLYRNSKQEQLDESVFDLWDTEIRTALFLGMEAVELLEPILSLRQNRNGVMQHSSSWRAAQ
ncbi:MAG: hypothetical protein K9L68_02515 [Spirochaetales bacterium]|nr:hypothetical protein [Spirochaetales bacterium]MCF7937450.1 hypothetical protein [Spirochaetales bacterium]